MNIRKQWQAQRLQELLPEKRLLNSFIDIRVIIEAPNFERTDTWQNSLGDAFPQESNELGILVHTNRPTWYYVMETSSIHTVPAHLRKRTKIEEEMSKLPAELRDRAWVSSVGLSEIASSFSEKTGRKIEEYIERIDALDDDTS